MFKKTKEHIDQFLILPVQVAVFFSAIILVEVGTRAFKLWKRELHEPL